MTIEFEETIEGDAQNNLTETFEIRAPRKGGKRVEIFATTNASCGDVKTIDLDTSMSSIAAARLGRALLDAAKVAGGFELAELEDA